MHESYCQVDLPFASNPQFLENYTNAHGGIRTGMLMEHLDSLAGSISYKHCVRSVSSMDVRSSGSSLQIFKLGPGQQLDNNVDKRGFYMVTAAVDR